MDGRTECYVHSAAARGDLHSCLLCASISELPPGTRRSPRRHGLIHAPLLAPFSSFFVSLLEQLRRLTLAAIVSSLQRDVMTSLDSYGLCELPAGTAPALLAIDLRSGRQQRRTQK